MIKEMDTDGDGKLSSAEHDASAASMFAAMDANKDGSLTKAELKDTADKMKVAKDMHH
jgi:Ca2+-binding EF-hand superfamily protein